MNLQQIPPNSASLPCEWDSVLTKSFETWTMLKFLRGDVLSTWCKNWWYLMHPHAFPKFHWAHHTFWGAVIFLIAGFIAVSGKVVKIRLKISLHHKLWLWLWEPSIHKSALAADSLAVFDQIDGGCGWCQYREDLVTTNYQYQGLPWAWSTASHSSRLWTLLGGDWNII